MPKDCTLKKILVIGAGPIIIGQGCEFDYSGTQACKALREEGCWVVLVNSNPATIMTDPEIADTTYLEPLILPSLEKIIERERPDALLPTMGGQTALNLTWALAQEGILERYGTRIIGLSLPTLAYAEQRDLFHARLKEKGLPTLPSSFITHLGELSSIEQNISLPVIVRSSFTLSGYGGGLAHTSEELLHLCQEGLVISPSGLLIEKSLEGWKEFELEVMRDHRGNAIAVCGIENIDPMGVHTGDSITVAPIQTLTDKEYQQMRLASFQVMEAVGMTSGGCNVQFAVDPSSGKMFCIEINPRVSRSSALASKATGFPIAKIASKLALGYSLDELQNDLCAFPASFEPSLDYVVVKLPFFPFDRFPQCERKLTPSMKAVGEVMAIGRTFQEALQKAIDSLDAGYYGLGNQKSGRKWETEPLLFLLKEPHPERLWFIAEAFRAGISFETIQEATAYDPWFLGEIEELVLTEQQIACTPVHSVTHALLLSWKRKGFSDKRLASIFDVSEETIWKTRHALQIAPTYKSVDTCAAEYGNSSSCFYSTFEEECEAPRTTKQKVIVLGSGANRIGQGIEFDYCCVHGLQAVQTMGYEAIMINNNPSTVSTDYDRSDRLYLEPLTVEKIHDICLLENPYGIIIQLGGQTPLNVGKELFRRGLPLLGTPFSSIERCENRELFRSFLKTMSLQQPHNSSFIHTDEACEEARQIGYPLIVRPSYVIGGSSIQCIYNESGLLTYVQSLSNLLGPILIEEFLEGGLEVEIDAIGDGADIFLCGMIEHLDPVGIHSGDSICSLTPLTLPQEIQQELKAQTKKIGLALGIIGLFNVQFCVVDLCTIYVLEVNPRASRTIPLLSKITGLPLVRIATRCMLGQSILAQGYAGEAHAHFYGMKVPVFPFTRMGYGNKLLGPRMLSTGETLGIGTTHMEAFAKGAFSIDTSLSLSPSVRQKLSSLSSFANYSPHRLQQNKN